MRNPRTTSLQFRLSPSARHSCRVRGRLVVATLCALSLPLSAATIVVDPSGSGDHLTIQPALDAARDGDVVLVRAGSFRLLAPLDLHGRRILLRAESGARETELFANGRAHACFSMTSGETRSTSIEGFTIRDGGGVSTELAGGLRAGGAVYIEDSSPSFLRCRFLASSAHLGGAIAIFARGARAEPLFLDCEIRECRAIEGGGVYSDGGSPSLVVCRVEDNEAAFTVQFETGAGLGGGLRLLGGAPSLLDCRIVENLALEAGGLFAENAALDLLRTHFTRNEDCGLALRGGHVRLDRCRVEEHAGRDPAPRPGTGLRALASDLVLDCRDTVIRANRSLGSGAGIAIGPGVTASFERCTIEENEGLGGGALLAEAATMHIVQTILRNNSALGPGGALALRSTHCEVSDSLVLGNRATRGGGIDATGEPALILRNVTITRNTAPEASAISCESRLSVLNSIVWDNDGAPELSADPLEAAFSIGPAGLFPGASNGSEDPRLLDDARLDPGSPAVDRGTNGIPSMRDLAGFARRCGERVDVGAYEHGDCDPRARPFRRGDHDLSDEVEISDAIALLGWLFLGASTAPRCADASDADDSGRIDIADAVAVLDSLFRTGTPLPPPGAETCGEDPTRDALACEESARCES